MDRLKVVVAPRRESTQILAMWGPDEVLRAVLGPPHQVHRLAAPQLLEGLSLWYQSPLCVVLSVDESGDSSALTQSLSDGRGIGQSTLCYQVAVVPDGGRRRGRALGGVGDFTSLRRLCQAGESWR
jgi:hypothetical protein